MADSSEKNVSYAMLVSGSDEFAKWLKDVNVGTAQIGDLLSVNGAVVDTRGYTAAIRVTLRDAGLTQNDPLTVIEPFVTGREVYLNSNQKGWTKALVLLGVTVLISLFGLWTITRKQKNANTKTVDHGPLNPVKRPVQKAEAKKLDEPIVAKEETEPVVAFDTPQKEAKSKKPKSGKKANSNPFSTAAE